MTRSSRLAWALNLLAAFCLPVLGVFAVGEGYDPLVLCFGPNGELSIQIGFGSHYHVHPDDTHHTESGHDEDDHRHDGMSPHHHSVEVPAIETFESVNLPIIVDTTNDDPRAGSAAAVPAVMPMGYQVGVVAKEAGDCGCERVVPPPSPPPGRAAVVEAICTVVLRA